jgi:hypothetical protein
MIFFVDLEQAADFVLNEIMAAKQAMVLELEQLAAGFVLVLTFLIYELDCKIFMDNLIASLKSGCYSLF